MAWRQGGAPRSAVGCRQGSGSREITELREADPNYAVGQRVVLSFSMFAGSHEPQSHQGFPFDAPALSMGRSSYVTENTVSESHFRLVEASTLLAWMRQSGRSSRGKLRASRRLSTTRLY